MLYVCRTVRVKLGNEKRIIQGDVVSYLKTQLPDEFESDKTKFRKLPLFMSHKGPSILITEYATMRTYSGRDTRRVITAH